MTDFDDVLERLLVDPSFQAALAADPSAALAGYQLAPDERDLLGAQVVGGSGEDRTVELRTSKSSMMGLLGPVVAAFGVAAGNEPVGAGGQQVVGGGPGHQSFGGGPAESFGSTPAHQSFGATPAHQSFGTVPAGSGGTTGPVETFGTTSHESFGSTPTGPATTGTAQFGSAPVPATDYHTHVDVDGDGKWDAYTAYERPDGGVDVDVDINHDGRVDFVGHDLNRDGLIDSADFDNNHDGVFETRMYDDTGDGWMDRQEAIPPGHADPTAPQQTWGDVATD